MQTFSNRVIKIALEIPKGKVATYGGISRAAGGGSMASRSVTGILEKAYNSGVKNIPFHRIVYSDGRVWMSPKYKKERMTLYKQEGIEIDTKGKIVNFRDIVLEFK